MKWAKTIVQKSDEIHKLSLRSVRYNFSNKTLNKTK